jgi:hypothetical protein
LIGKRWHSNVTDVRYFSETVCDTDHYPVLVKVRDRLSVSKRAMQKYDMESFNLKKLHDVEFRAQHQVEMSNRHPGLGSWMIMWISLGLEEYERRYESFSQRESR